MTCSSCKHFKPEQDSEKSGTCHRFPPVPMRDAGWGVWPMVHREDACGEWKKQDAEPCVNCGDPVDCFNTTGLCQRCWEGKHPMRCGVCKQATDRCMCCPQCGNISRQCTCGHGCETCGDSPLCLCL